MSAATTTMRALVDIPHDLRLHVYMFDPTPSTRQVLRVTTDDLLELLGRYPVDVDSLLERQLAIQLRLSAIPPLISRLHELLSSFEWLVSREQGVVTLVLVSSPDESPGERIGEISSILSSISSNSHPIPTFDGDLQAFEISPRAPYHNLDTNLLLLTNPLV